MQNKIITFLSILFCSLIANAFPEMIRHGYVHCTTCHVSPAGGGLLTAYGRSLSREVLSRWGNEGEGQLLHGILNETRFNNWINSDEDKGLLIGGDLRWVQTHKENEITRDRRAFLMQADLEAAYRWEWGSFGVTYGQQKPGLSAQDSTVFKPMVLRRWNFILHRFDTLWMRFGLGSPHWGIVSSEHVWSFRNNLGFHPLDRRHLAELEHQGEAFGALIGHAESDDTNPLAAREVSDYGTIDLIIGLNKKVGVDIWSGRFPGSSRRMQAAHTYWGWNEHWVTLAQFTSQQAQATNPVSSWFFFQKTSWEFTRGLWASLVNDIYQSDQSVPTTNVNKYGLGLQFFPRPHFELQLDYLRVRDRTVSEVEGDMGFLILHYYL